MNNLVVMLGFAKLIEYVVVNSFEFLESRSLSLDVLLKPIDLIRMAAFVVQSLKTALNLCGADPILHLPLDGLADLQYSTTFIMVSYDVSGAILGIFEGLGS